MRKKSDVKDYKNFWLIWINCAGKPEEGVSLFKIQNRWDIKTNYLYHNEMGLKKPLYIRMIKDKILSKEGKKLKPKFAWIPAYVKEQYLLKGTGNQWFPVALMSVKWPIVQKFIEEHSETLFNIDALKVLYKNDRELLGKHGPHIFSDIFLLVLFFNLILFCRKYKAEVVLRIISTIVSTFSDRDLLNYIRTISLKIGKDIPVLVRSEEELNKFMYPFKW
jgi:hypothetical protein